MVTLDRVKNMEIEADVRVWQEYARKGGIHPAIRTYLSLYPDHFYNITNTDRGQLFVTARGWEDLSCILLSYEQDGESVDAEFFLQYLQHDEIARSFAMYYDLFRHFTGEGSLAERLAADPERLASFTATECLAAAALLFNPIRSAAADWAESEKTLALQREQLLLIGDDCDFTDEAKKEAYFRARRKALDVRVEHDVIRPEEEMRSRRVLDALERSAGDWLKGDRAQSFSSFAAEQMDTQQAQLGSAAEEILSRIGEAYAVLEKCPRGRSALLYLTTDLGGDDALSQLLQQYECEPWLRYSRELLQEE